MLGPMTLVIHIATKLFSDSEMLRQRFEASLRLLCTPTFFHLGLLLIVFTSYGIILTTSDELVVSNLTQIR